MTAPITEGRLAGRRIIVTGAASGIGRVTAQHFVSHGAKVAFLDRDATGAADAAAAFGGIHGQVDVADEHSVAKGIESAAAELGGIDGLVNSAGVVALGTTAEMQLDVWDRVMRVNLTGTFLMCRAAIPFLQREERATIVNIASAQALLPIAGAGAYAASKGGVLAFSKAIATELAPKIRVNTICPGLVDTPMNAGLKKAPEDGPPVPLDRYALRRWAEPQEIAAALLFLTSHDSSYVTGAALAVDGGRTFH